MEDYRKYYERNKKLDELYINKYSYSAPNYYEKNCLGLIVELGELANESKCFKYWTMKKPNREELLEEYADCLSMLLCIFNFYNVDEIDVIDMELSNDVVLMFNDTIRMCTLLMNKDNVDERLLREIFTYLLHIGKLLELNDNDILDACYKKIEINEERLRTDY